MSDQTQLTTKPTISLTKKALSQHDFMAHVLKSSVFPLTEADVDRRNQIRSLARTVRWGGLLAVNTLGLLCYRRYKPLKNQIAIASILGSLGSIIAGDYIGLFQTANYLKYRFEISKDSIPEQNFNGNLDRYLENKDFKVPQK